MRRLIGILIFLAASAAMVFAAFDAVERRDKLSTYVASPATVMADRAVSSAEGGKGVSMPAPVIIAEPGDGAAVRFQVGGDWVVAPLQASLLDYVVPPQGMIQVLYDPSDLRNVIRDDPLALYERPLLMALVGIVVLLVGMIAVSAGPTVAIAGGSFATPPRNGRQAAGRTMEPAASAGSGYGVRHASEREPQTTAAAIASNVSRRRVEPQWLRRDSSRRSSASGLGALVVAVVIIAAVAAAVYLLQPLPGG